MSNESQVLAMQLVKLCASILFVVALILTPPTTTSWLYIAAYIALLFSWYLKR